MPKPLINIGGKEFKSAAALTRYARSVVESYEDGQMMRVDDFYFFADLVIRRHDTPDEKFVPGRIEDITGIIVRHESGCPHFGRSATNRNHCRVVYSCGEEIDFSWKSCCEGTFSAAGDANHALRRAAEPHVREYKRRRFSAVGGSPCCDATRSPLTFRSCQVDHYPLTWVALRERFLDQESLRLEDIRTVQVVPEGGCRLEDKVLEDRFQKYHLSTATLRLVTVEVNRSSWRNTEAIRK